MGFSVSAGFLILSIAVFYALGASISVFRPAVNELISVEEELRDIQEKKLSTKLEIIQLKVTGRGAYYGINVTLLNNGSVTLDPTQFDILIDGYRYPFEWYPKTKLYPKTVTWLEVAGLKGSGWHTLKIVSESGIETYAKYWVRA